MRTAACLLFVLLAGCSGKEPATKEADGSLIENRTALKASASEMFDDVERDLDSARNKYNGKQVELTAVVVAFRWREEEKGWQLALAPSADYSIRDTIDCRIPGKKTDAIDKLHGGNIIIVRGRCGLNRFNSKPFLFDAELVQIAK